MGKAWKIVNIKLLLEARYFKKFCFWLWEDLLLSVVLLKLYFNSVLAYAKPACFLLGYIDYSRFICYCIIFMDKHIRDRQQLKHTLKNYLTQHILMIHCVSQMLTSKIELIFFKSLLTTFEASVIFWVSRAGSSNKSRTEQA